MPQVRKVASLRRLFHFLLRARFQTDSQGQRDDGGGGGVLLVAPPPPPSSRRPCESARRWRRWRQRLTRRRLAGAAHTARRGRPRAGVIGTTAHRLGAQWLPSATRALAASHGTTSLHAAEVLKEYNTSSNISTTQRGVKSSFFTLGAIHKLCRLKAGGAGGQKFPVLS